MDRVPMSANDVFSQGLEELIEKIRNSDVQLEKRSRAESLLSRLLRHLSWILAFLTFLGVLESIWDRTTSGLPKSIIGSILAAAFVLFFVQIVISFASTRKNEGR
jgi:hypothetical protein